MSSIVGVVVDEQGAPIASAHVRVQATDFATRTNAAGDFRLSFLPSAESRAVAAWKEGYYDGGERIEASRSAYRIALRPLPLVDHPGRAWTSARGSGQEACGRCHPALLAEWERSAHSTSAVNPLFLASYTGVDPSGAPTGAPSYRVDFPQAAGNCATCHVPGLALDAPFAARPDQASDIATEGVFCEFCHKVKAATVDETGGKPGVLSLAIVRAEPGRDVFFGPLDDVIGRRDSYLPLYRQSTFCAPCHQGSFWNVRAYSEFDEWSKSSFAKRNVECQDCHMRAEAGPARRMAIAEEGGVVRDGSTLSSHALRGTADAEFLRASIALRTEVTVFDGGVTVRASVQNVGAGHDFPTGSPMRNLLLVVEARDAGATPLELLSGDRLPEWAGRGSQPGDWAGLPGRGFAKILSDLVEYPADRAQGRSFDRFVPAPYWRPAKIASDTRIAAGATDASEYRFRLAAVGAWPVTVIARLIYRRTFRSWGHLDRIKGGDLELVRTQDHVDSPSSRPGRTL